MKPVVTWILIANAQTARIVQNCGPGKGVTATNEAALQAPPPVAYADTPGVAQNSASQSHSAMKRRAPQDLAETAFAKAIMKHLATAHSKAKFDRLVVAAAPHFLGELRAQTSDALRKALWAEIDKDLVQLKLDQLPKHLGDVMAI